MPKKKPKKGKPEVHDDLKGFDIKINEFGEIVSSYEVDKLNEFLNENVDDKKLRGQEDTEPLEEEDDEDSEDDPDDDFLNKDHPGEDFTTK